MYSVFEVAGAQIGSQAQQHLTRLQVAMGTSQWGVKGPQDECKGQIYNEIAPVYVG